MGLAFAGQLLFLYVVESQVRAAYGYFHSNYIPVRNPDREDAAKEKQKSDIYEKAMGSFKSGIESGHTLFLQIF